MRLHEDQRLFRQAVIATAESLQIPEIYIEKDYWVTYALQGIFSDAVGAQTIFKGGTSLSKCYGLIERFSEDIDLVVTREAADSGNQIKTRLKRIGAAVSRHLPEIEMSGLTRRRGMNRKTVHGYPQAFAGSPGQVRASVVVVEATSLGSFEPYNQRPISTYLAEMMRQQNQEELIAQYGLDSFPVNALRPERTLCEKIMSLVRFSYTEHPLEDLKLKIRHAYDLYKMLNNTDIQAFFESDAFDTLFLSAARSDIVSYKNNHAYLVKHPAKARIFSDLESVWPELEPIYRGDFANLVFGELPKAEEVRQTLARIKARLSKLEWPISNEL
jgi:hypothetical protein